MIQRVPIKVPRKPIKLPLSTKMEIKLYETQQFTKTDDILEMSRHYDMLVVKHTDKLGYYSLSFTEQEKHRNWPHFERIWEICRMKDWDAKLYIESQFTRKNGWGTLTYPQPSAMYSVAAIKHFVQYFGDLNKKYKFDTNADQKKKGSETVALRQHVIDEVLDSIEILASYVQNSKFEDKGQYKALKIYQSWNDFSPYYLWTVPWFHGILNGMATNNRVEACQKEFQRIQQSKSLQKLVTETVEKLEKHFNVPGNINL